MDPAWAVLAPPALTAAAVTAAYGLLRGFALQRDPEMSCDTASTAAAAAIGIPFLLTAAIGPAALAGPAAKAMLWLIVPLLTFILTARWRAHSDPAERLRAERIVIGLWTVAALTFAIRTLVELGGGHADPRLLTGLLAVGALFAYRWVRRAAGGVWPRRIWTVSATALAVAAAGAWILDRGGAINEVQAASQVSPPVVLLTIDTLRADVLSAYGGPVKTPNLDALAADGILFERAYSTAPWTKPAMLTMLSGLSPFVHGADRMESAPPPNLPLIGAAMQRSGRETAAFGYNGFLTARGSAGLLPTGFDLFEIGPSSPSPTTLSTRVFGDYLPSRYRRTETTEGVTEAALERLAEREAAGFFLWVHYYDPHGPYEPPARFSPGGAPIDPVGEDLLSALRIGSIEPTPEIAARLRAAYEGEVRLVDENVGRLIKALKDAGVYDEALIVISSDHGEELLDHGSVDHGHSFWEEHIRVPLAIKPPASAADIPEAGTRIAKIVSTASVAPTILDICGLLDDPEAFSAASLRAAWESPEAPAIAFSTAPYALADREAVIFGDYKYIRWTRFDRERLFNLSRDPGERHDLAGFKGDAVERGRILLDAERARSAKLRDVWGLEDVGGRAVELDEGELERLRSLGYL